MSLPRWGNLAWIVYPSTRRAHPALGTTTVEIIGSTLDHFSPYYVTIYKRGYVDAVYQHLDMVDVAALLITTFPEADHDPTPLG